ncbi:MAG: glutamine--fructose-6-phosphate transaminase (isomerizing) [Verrucomicrobia bacterium]|jgi:glucosamine--fructose-6-phosphate aminotransferase (isomerizing)|nr:glutamine--fructose-6-phosphate transaminase (isomerizing) [Verrucomicrobiota bacterium]
MCGIVGYIGKQAAASVLLDGLRRLEYRGYDSAGISIRNGEGFQTLKRTGRVQDLYQEAMRAPDAGTIGISHTRWATHGGVTNQNAHPHLSHDGRLSLVHNGVIENYGLIKRELIGKGVEFESETDSETLVNLIALLYAAELQDPVNEGKPREALMKALRAALAQVEGTYGIALLCADMPDLLFGARKGSPLVIGVGNGENFLASDVTAFAGRTQNVVYLDDGQLAVLSQEDFSVTTLDEVAISPVVDTISWDIEDAELGSYTHFMQKEIFEQPMALENAMRGRFSQDGSTAQFGGLNIEPRELRQVDRILFLGCGTAWHACLVAEYLIEKFARIPVEVEYSSEFRYRNAPLEKNTLVFTLSQSGETIDTLEAQREAQRKGYRVLGITNVVGSTIARENDGGIYQHSGPEIGVASTKAFTAQCHIAAMLGLYFGRMRDMSYSDGCTMVSALRKAPGLIAQALSQAEKIEAIAKKYARFEDFLFLGRQLMFPIALEGALKLKEISYIHAEGYPAAEMKHGPIALISPECPTVAIALKGEIYKKSLANIQEIKARRGPVIAITDAGKEFPQDLADEVIHLPETHEVNHAVLVSVPMQLLSYYIAVERACDVDKPRNLAKSVTVE